MENREPKSEKTGSRKIKNVSKKENSSGSHKLRIAFILAIMAGYGAIWYVKSQQAAPSTLSTPVATYGSEEDFGVIFNTPITKKADSLFSATPAIYKSSCGSREEKIYCDLIPDMKMSPWGASEDGGIIRVAFNGLPFREEAFALFKELHGNAGFTKKQMREYVWTYALMYLLRDHFTKVKEEDIKDHRVRFEFWTIENDEPVQGYSVFFPDGYRILHLAKIAGMKNPIRFKERMKSEQTLKMIRKIAIEDQYYGQEYEGMKK